MTADSYLTRVLDELAMEGYRLDAGNDGAGWEEMSGHQEALALLELGTPAALRLQRRANDYIVLELDQGGIDTYHGAGPGADHIADAAMWRVDQQAKQESHNERRYRAAA